MKGRDPYRKEAEAIARNLISVDRVPQQNNQKKKKQKKDGDGRQLSRSPEEKTRSGEHFGSNEEECRNRAGFPRDRDLTEEC